jgi:hypothetical protein
VPLTSLSVIQDRIQIPRNSTVDAININRLSLHIRSSPPSIRLFPTRRSSSASIKFDRYRSGIPTYTILQSSTPEATTTSERIMGRSGKLGCLSVLRGCSGWLSTRTYCLASSAGLSAFCLILISPYFHFSCNDQPPTSYRVSPHKTTRIIRESPLPTIRNSFFLALYLLYRLLIIVLDFHPF